jgi:hypothetical protein
MKFHIPDSSGSLVNCIHPIHIGVKTLHMQYFLITSTVTLKTESIERFDRPLLVSRFRTTVRSVLPKKPLSTKLPFCWYCYLPEDAAYSVLFRWMISINYWNMTRIVGAVFEKIHCFVLRCPSVMDPYFFGARMLIVSGHRRMMDKLVFYYYLYYFTIYIITEY